MKEYFRSYIERKQLIILFSLISVLSSSFDNLLSQEIQKSPTRQSSIETFSKGNYEQAYNEFSQLLLTYPKDPLYKYYSGVCLVKLKKDIDKAVTLLHQSIMGATVVKSLPPDALFYLGKARQMAGKFSEAAETYNLYTEQVGKKAAREQGVPDLIQQCNRKEGMVAEAESITDGIIINEKAEKNIQSIDIVVNEEVEATPGEKVVYEITYLPPSYEMILDEALEFQFKADSLNLLAGKQKIESDKLPDTEKQALKLKISENELLAASFQKSADQKYKEAESLMNPQKDKMQEDVLSKQPDNKILSESVNISENSVSADFVKQSDTVKRIVPDVKKPIETFVFFKILPKPVSDPREKVSVEPEVPAGLIYRIQIAVFRNPVSPSYFKGITPVYGFKVAGTDKTTYYAGMFRRSGDSKKALAEVKAKGFKDAFIVALMEKKPVSADRAAILEKEWGKKPFIDLVKSPPETALDTIPPALSFRVEVIRSAKPLKEDIVEGIRKMAGSRGLDIIDLDDGNIVYLIGKFITFESAEDYADLLIRNNYRAAKVIGWMGNGEIPVETARQLFNNLE